MHFLNQSEALWSSLKPKGTMHVQERVCETSWAAEIGLPTTIRENVLGGKVILR